jgi:F-type H+-transporting ATPase subunit b
MKFINFAVLAGILFYFLRKPVSQGLADRRESIRKELEEALQAKEAAQAKYREYQARVANLEAEVRQLQADFKAEGERQQARIVADAEKAAQTIRRQAEAAADTEVKRASDELRAEAADLAVRLAEQILAKAYTSEDQKKAVALTIQNIEGVH